MTGHIQRPNEGRVNRRVWAFRLPTRMLIATTVFLAGLLSIAVILSQPTKITVTQLLCYVFACGTAGLLYFALFDEQMQPSGLDLHRPVALYGFFYALYYVFPLAIFAHDPWTAKHNLAFMLVAILLGFIGFYAGVQLSGWSVPRTRVVESERISVQDGKAVLMLCYLSITFVALHFGYKIATGQFFSHASEYTVETSVSASLLKVFCGAFPFFAILLLGFAAKVCDQVIARRASTVLNFYVLTLYAMFLASSQFRDSLTALLLYVVARQLAGKRVIDLKQVVIVACLAAFSLLVIYEVRATVDQSKIASAPEQAGYAIGQTYDAASIVLSGNALNRENSLQIESRASSAVKFLSLCRDALYLGGEHLRGATFMASIAAQIPRVFWKDKPAKLPTQRLINRELHLPDEDASPSPVTQFYVEWGIPGVVLGFVAFGLSMGMLTRFAFQKYNVPLLILTFWIWCSCVQVETELFGGALSALRLSAVTILLYYVFRGCVQLMSRVLERNRVL